MRSLVLSNRIRCLSQVAFVGIIAGLSAGCSSDFTRFDRNLYSALPRSANQQQANPYPGDVDPTTTAGVRSVNPRPIDSVNERRSFADHAGYQPEMNQNPYPSSDQIAPQAYHPAPNYNSGVVKSSLPKPVITTSKVVGSKTATPGIKPATSGKLIDPVRTSSVTKTNQALADTRQAAITPVAAVQQQSAAINNGVGGWSGAGGTSVTMRSGETLYNLSKRYGVPVKEIMRVNNIKSASSISEGQRIVIPTYVYSQRAPVSAPDSDPNTKAARASRGLMGQANINHVITPTRRPNLVASVSDSQIEELNPTLQKRYRPKPRVEDNSNTNVPDYSIVTGSVARPDTVPMDGIYTVKSGDSLSIIAARNGIKTKDLMQANGLTESNIRVGQSLRIPQAGSSIVASKTQLPANVDPIVTGSVKKPVSGPKAYTKPTLDKTVTNSANTKAPSSTGIDNLRRPVSGHIISSFGQKRSNGPNDGVDFAVPEGTPVKAAENGVVIYSGDDLEGFGNLILLRHSNGLVTAYAHNKTNNVRKNARVARGQVIARSGRTGGIKTPMLHFEVRKNSKPVDPMKYLGG